MDIWVVVSYTDGGIYLMPDRETVLHSIAITWSAIPEQEKPIVDIRSHSVIVTDRNSCKVLVTAITGLPIYERGTHL